MGCRSGEAIRSRVMRDLTSSVTSSVVSRRGVLAGGAALLFITACGGGDDGASDTTGAAADGGELVGTLLILLPAQGVLSANGPVRIPVAVADPEGVPIRDDLPVRSFRIRTDAGEVTEVEVAPHADGVPTPYYPVVFTPTTTGIHEITAVEEGYNPITVDIAETVPLPEVGQPLPPVETPTTADARGVDPICTATPPCPLHEVTQAEALATGRPVAYLIATPEFCQTAICGPVLDLLVEATADFPDVVAVHAEVYADPRGDDDPTAGGLAPAAADYDLSFEPVLYVTDGTGTIVNRLDTVYDREELRATLAAVTA